MNKLNHTEAYPIDREELFNPSDIANKMLLPPTQYVPLTNDNIFSIGWIDMNLYLHIGISRMPIDDAIYDITSEFYNEHYKTPITA